LKPEKFKKLMRDICAISKALGRRIQ